MKFSPLKAIATLLICGAVLALADYDATLIGDLDPARPAQSEDPKLAAAQSIRETRRATKNSFLAQHQSSGVHSNNFLATAMIQDGAVTSDKLATGSVTAAKIVAGTVTADKLARGAGGPVFISPSSLVNANVTKTGAWVSWSPANVPTNAFAIIVWAKWVNAVQNRVGTLHARQPSTGSTIPVVAALSSGGGDNVVSSGMAIVPCANGAIEYQVDSYDNGTIDLVVYGYWP